MKIGEIELMNCDCQPFDIKERNGHSASCNREQRKAEKEALKPVKKQKPIKKVSENMGKTLNVYSHEKRIFLIENPNCAVYPNLPSDDVHHKKGRATIELLLDKVYWLPVSRKAHIRIENNPEWAKEKGFSLMRTQTEPHAI